jgi:S1-C subfamily serine protease
MRLGLSYLNNYTLEIIMTKKLVTFVILSSLIIGGIGGWLMMRFALPQLNTISILRKYNLVPKTGPLTIHTREEIRVNEGSDSIAAIQMVRPWVVGIVSGADQSRAEMLGAGLIITSDGLIATVQNALSGTEPYKITLSDGTVLDATLVATDPASDLVFLKANGSNLATASLGFPKDLQLGQRIVILSPSLGQYQGSDSISFLSSEVRNIDPSKILSSDKLNRTFGVSSVFDALEGAATFSLDANVQGLFSKNGIITSDAIKSALSSYFTSGKIQRSSLGLYYQVIPKSVSNIYKIPEGVIIKRSDSKVPAVVSGSPADKTGIQEGDVVTKVNDVQITFDNAFEELLGNFGPGQTIRLSIVRNNQNIVLNTTLAAQ